MQEIHGSMDIRQQVIPYTGRCHQKMLIESFDLSSFKVIGTRPRLPEIREFWSSSLNGHIRDTGTRRIFDQIEFGEVNMHLISRAP